MGKSEGQGMLMMEETVLVQRESEFSCLKISYMP
jgi:hypothetical protein